MGSIVRKAGQALDSLGLAVQGKYGYREGGEGTLQACWQDTISALLIAQRAI